MTLRGARVLLANACTPAGSSLVEALLAVGAQVIAADGLRTRLEELRGRMRQHDRLWVAECDLSGEHARALFADVGRDEPIDAALLVLCAAERAGAAAQAAPVMRCRWFLDAACAVMAGQDRGRVLVVLGPGNARDLAAEIAPLVDDACARAHAGPAVGGLVVEGELHVWRGRVLALADPAQPPVRGFSPAR